MILNGSEILVNVLLEQGVDTVFGYPGGAVLNIYDALYKYSDKITHYMTAHEQGAAHAADGYARATGKRESLLQPAAPARQISSRVLLRLIWTAFPWSLSRVTCPMR